MATRSTKPANDRIAPLGLMEVLVKTTGVSMGTGPNDPSRPETSHPETWSGQYRSSISPPTTGLVPVSGLAAKDWARVKNGSPTSLASIGICRTGRPWSTRRFGGSGEPVKGLKATQ